MKTMPMIRAAIAASFMPLSVIAPAAAAESDDGVVRMHSELLNVTTLKGPENVFGTHVNVPRTVRLISRRGPSDGAFATEMRVTDAYEDDGPRHYAEARLADGDIVLEPKLTIVNEIPGVSDFEEIMDFPLPLDRLPEGEDIAVELIADEGDRRSFRIPARLVDMQRRAIAEDGG